MPLKTVTVQGRQFRLGRKPPTTQDRRFLTGLTLFDAAVPAPPQTIPIPASYAPGLAYTFMNTQLGCCVIAHHAHFLANLTSHSGRPFIYTDQQIIRDYSAVGGYVPGHPETDNGCNIEDDLYYLKHTGFADHSRLTATMHINPTSRTSICQSVWLTGGICFGMSMPDAWINPAPQHSGFVWDVAGPPDDENGHCFLGFAYPTQKGIAIATWGMTGTITWAAIAKYGDAKANGELHSYINPAIVNPTGIAANGFNLKQITTYFNAMGGR